MPKPTVSVKIAFNNLSAIAQDIHAAASELVDNTAQRVYDVSQQLVPVDTGALKASGAIEETGEQGRTVTYGEGLPDARAVWMEYGTSTIAPRAYLTRAAAAVRSEFNAEAKSLVQQAAAGSGRVRRSRRPKGAPDLAALARSARRQYDEDRRRLEAADRATEQP